MSRINLDRLEKHLDRVDVDVALSQLVRAEDGAFGSRTFRDLFESEMLVGKVNSRDGVTYHVLLDWPGEPEPLLYEVHRNVWLVLDVPVVASHPLLEDPR